MFAAAATTADGSVPIVGMVPKTVPVLTMLQSVPKACALNLAVALEYWMHT